MYKIIERIIYRRSTIKFINKVYILHFSMCVSVCVCVCVCVWVCVCVFVYARVGL